MDAHLSPIPPESKAAGCDFKAAGHIQSRTSVDPRPLLRSGTALLAARELGRHAIGIEIEERFCELAGIRLSQRAFQFTPAPPQYEQLSLNVSIVDPCLSSAGVAQLPDSA